jgi:putative hydrolase of the HAD superfamily
MLLVSCMPDACPNPFAILFDLDNTLIASSMSQHEMWAAALDQTGMLDGKSADKDQVVDSLLNASRSFWSEPVRHRDGRMNIPVARRKIAENGLAPFAELGASAGDVVGDMHGVLHEQTTDLLPRALETLVHFRERGVHLALVTNGTSDIQRAKVEKFDLERYVDHLQIEGEFGIGKPMPAAYHIALRALGARAEESWMVGDNLEWEVTVPQQLGMHTVWRDPHGKGLPEGSAVRPDKIVLNVAELIA